MTLVEAFWAWAAIAGRSPATIRNYGYALGNWTRAGVIVAADATPAAVAAYVARRLRASEGGLRIELAALSTVLRYLITLGEALPAQLATVRAAIPRHKRARPLHARFLTRAEYERLRDAAEGRARLAIVIGALAGLRAGELARLRWSDVDLERRVLYVRLDPALGAEGRIKTMHERVVPAVEELRRELAAVPRAGDFVLPPGGRSPRPHASAGSLRFRVGRARRRAGVLDATFHVLRHTRASWWLQAGVPLVKVALWIGNTPVVCARAYAGLLVGYDPECERGAA